MDNTINNISFRANVKSISKIKNKEAFVEVKKLFENSTKNDIKDTMYITDGIMGYNRIVIGDSYKSLFTRGINEQLKTMGTEDFAKKLVKIYESLKSHEKAIEKNNELNSELNRAKALLKINRSISSACATEGKTGIARRFSVLAQRNEQKIDALTKEINNRLNTFNKKIDELSEQYEELSDLKINL